MNPWDTISTNNTVQNDKMRQLEKRLNQEADNTPKDADQHTPIAKVVDAIRTKLGNPQTENRPTAPATRCDVTV